MERSERRSNSRVPTAISVKCRLPDGRTTTSEFIRNISMGGVFIEMESPLPFGSELSLEFSLPVAPRVIRCQGFVVWSTKSSPERSPDGMEGIGVRLMGIGITEMRVLNEYVAETLSG